MEVVVTGRWNLSHEMRQKSYAVYDGNTKTQVTVGDQNKTKLFTISHIHMCVSKAEPNVY